MYLRAKYTKYKMAKTKFSIWRYIICEICKKNGSNRPFLASRVADTIFPPPIEGHHRQLDNQCKDPMDNNKDCRVGQLTNMVLNLESLQSKDLRNLSMVEEESLTSISTRTVSSSCFASATEMQRFKTYKRKTVTEWVCGRGYKGVLKCGELDLRPF